MKIGWCSQMLEVGGLLKVGSQFTRLGKAGTRLNCPSREEQGASRGPGMPWYPITSLVTDT